MGRIYFYPFIEFNKKMNDYAPKLHKRRSIRLKGYDYKTAGLYFVTLCCQNRENLFGMIDNLIMSLNDAGRMIEKIWKNIPDDFKNIYLHEYIIMPNHIHGIIEITGRDRAEMDSAPTCALPEIIQSFKRQTTIEYIKKVKCNILPLFDKRVWQRNYWDRIIRNENEYNKISEYIRNNHLTWEDDKLNGGLGNKVLESLDPYNIE